MAGIAVGLRLAEGRTTTHGLLLALFIVSLLVPINFSLGVRMNPSRLFLLVCAVPFALKLFGGRVGGFTWVDGSLLVFSLLIILALAYHHGPSQLPYALSQVVEVFGGYMAGRVMIRSLEDYRRFIRYFLVALAVLLPFALDEMIHGRLLFSSLFSRFFETLEQGHETRFGLSRVQAVFPHPILYGLFCAMGFASVVALYHKQPLRRLAYLGLVVATTLTSLSSAPLLSILLQSGLIVWGKITRGAWKTLAGLFVAAFLFLEMFSNRGPVVLFIELLTIDSQTGWWRILIWQYGSQNVMDHPLLGIGLNDWVRPYWMYSSSVDNFWLLIAMRYGLFAFGSVLLAFVLHVTFIARVRAIGEDARALRLGYLVTLVGLIFILSTVFVWDATAVFVMFFLGAGAFLYTSDVGEEGQPPLAASDGPKVNSAYSRFPQTTGRRSGPTAPASSQLPRTR